ncbi:MAG TPA: L-threonylcarbamoyladenylate synthase [Flavipsychrobacter sp.]|nr:L-threonylcarbamoyladenylate synthase [Flavipsychrobacter sp.]
MVDFEQDIRNCINILEQGGTILYPTDTVWGLGCDALNEAAIEKIFSIKNRPKEKSLIILLAETKDILRYVASPPPDIIDIVENFERPTTVIYNHALEFPDNAVHENGSIAIRVTTDLFCKALIKRLRKPLVSTSANISGAPTPSTFSRVANVIKQQVDYIVAYRQTDETIAAPSRLIKLTDDGDLEILRP